MYPVGTAVFSLRSVSNAAANRTPATPPRTESHRRCFSGVYVCFYVFCWLPLYLYQVGKLSL